MVTSTSKQAYKAVSESQVLAVAEYLHARTVAGRYTSDADIAAALCIPKSTAAARRNDLLKEGVFYAKDGYKWRPFLLQNSKYDRRTRCNVQAWCMVIFSEDLQTPLFKKTKL